MENVCALASDVCLGEGRPSALRRALCHIPTVGQAPGLPGPQASAWEPRPPSLRSAPHHLCHHGVEMRTPPLVSISQFLFSEDLGPGISAGPWKAVPKGRAAHLRAE